MSRFDPDAYLATSEFDPDAWLKTKETPAFDPDSWLKASEPEEPSAAPFKAFAKSAVSGIGAAAKGAEVIAYSMPPADEYGRMLDPERAEEYKRRMLQPASAQLKEIQQGSLFTWGKAVQDAAAELYQVSDAQTRSMITQVGGMAGGFLPLLASGPAAPITIGFQTVGDNLEEDYQRQIEKGKTADEAADHAISRSLASGPVQAMLFEVLPKPLQSFGNQILDKFGRSVMAKFLAGRVAQAGEGAALGAASHAADNLTMDRPTLEGTGESAAGLGLMQALMPRGAHGPLDTGKNIPESRATLEAQQEQLAQGLRPAQMFPLGTEELPLPKGMQRIETERGVFHFNPQLVTGEEVLKATQQGRENDVLALGGQSKADVDARAAQGEQRVAVTERTPHGTEVKTAVATDRTAPQTLAELNQGKTPGNVVTVEPLAKVPAERSANLVDDLLQRDAARLEEQRAAAAREALEREQRQRELAEKRARFDERIAVARDVMARPDASFAEVNGALESVKFYAEDNSLGLNVDQRQLAARAQAALAQRAEGMKAAELARREKLRAESEELRTRQDAEQRAQREAAAAEFERQQAAGVGATGEFDYSTAPLAALEQRAEQGDPKAHDALMRRNATEGETREDLLSVLRSVKLPASDEALGTELRSLISEGMTPKQRMELVSTKRASLDRTAEALRERGFSSVQTPSDVIDLVHRALRGEKIYAERTGEGQVELAARRPAWDTVGDYFSREPLSDADAEREISAIRKAFPQLVRENDLQLGDVQRALAQRGYQGEVPEHVQAAVARLKGQRTLIVLSARAYRDRAKGSGLLTHEMAHPFWDTLPQATKDELRALHEREVNERTGPLYREGKLQSELDFVEDMDERGHKEWFAERIARLNEAWARGEIDRAESGVLRRVAYQLREFIARVWATFARRDGIDPESELFVEHFRRFFESGGNQQIGREAGAAYAREKGAEFATGKEPASKVETTEKRYDQLREEFDRATADTEKIRAEMRPLWESQEPDAEVRLRALNDALTESENHAKNIYTRLTALRKDLDAAQPTKAKLPEGKTAGQVIAEAARTEALPKVDRRAALLTELQRGRDLASEGNRTNNDATLAEGVRVTKLARERLDAEFPGWERDQASAAQKKAALLNSGVGKERGATPAAEPELAHEADREKSPFAEPGKEMPVREHKLGELYGNSSYKPTALARTWDKVREVFRGIKGSVPELPTFAGAAWNRSDQFIREHGPNFYDGIKALYRKLISANDGIQRQAEEDVAKITKPLIEAGGPFNPNDYARLTKLQETARRIRAEGRDVPERVTHEIAALNSRLEASPYVLFNRLVLMLDLNWRQQNLKDSQGNPIRLPGGINEAEIKAELARLGEKIAASDHEAAIRTALEQHMALVKRVAEDLQTRELMPADTLGNPYYFPHLTLEVTRGGKTEERELRPARVKPGTEAEFRGYLIDPVGSTKPIETDYVNALYYHLVQVGAHNAKADAVRDFARPYDIKAQVEATARQLAKERGVPVSWEQAFHEKYAPRGYVLYGTDSRDAFPSITVDRDKLARRLGVMLTSEDLQRQLANLGLKGVKLLPEDLRETLQQGARETWVVPARVAEALRGIADRQNADDGAIDKALKFTVGAWKAWKLFMPWNHVRYEYGNVTADVEKLASASPQTFKYFPEAAKEVRAFWLGGEPSEDLRAAVKEGVINTITAQEMHALQRQPNFRAFEPWQEKLKQETKAWLSAPVANASRLFGKNGVLGRVTSVEESAFREAVFRYAKFKGDLKALREGARPAYAGAYWRDIDAMQDSRPGAGDADVRKAAAISKATFGDYGDLSVLGQSLRDKFVPFYSWMEVNFKYHANLLRNLRDMVRAGEMSQADAAKAGGRAAAVLAAGFTARAAGGVMLRLALPYVAVALWNNSGDRNSLEKLLSEEDKRRFHVILGESKDGNTTLRDGRKIEVVYGNTALMDVMKWFSGPKFVQSMAGWLHGRKDFPAAFTEWRDQLGPDLVNNVAQSVGPAIKIPYTLASKKNPFPDVTDQRTVPAYDMRRVILGQITDEFTADQIEKLVNKDYYASKDLGDWAKQLVLQVRSRDPESWAFYEIKDKADSFLEKQTGQKRSNSYDAPDQQVLRNFRRAIFRGDLENATRFYVRLLDYGYTAERFAASIRAQDPLSELPKENGLRRAFVESLPAVDRELLERAYAYYTRINASKGHEAQLFPRKETGARGMDRYRTAPRTEALRGMMERVGARDEDEELLRADRALRDSLRRTR